MTQATDVNGQPESYSYDIFGRLCTVRGPDDQSSSDATITMSYGIFPGSCPGGPTAGAAFPAYAVTRHKDVQHAGDPIDTVTFVDGLERVIQTKKDLDRDQNGNGTVVTGMTVSGQVLFDGRGRVKSQAQPAFSTAATTTFVAAGNGGNPTMFTYDEVDRPSTVNVPDGTAQGIQTTTLYSILPSTAADALGDGRTWMLTDQRDGNAPLPPAASNVGRRLSYSDARGNQVGVREFNQVGIRDDADAAHDALRVRSDRSVAQRDGCQGERHGRRLRHGRAPGDTDQSRCWADRVPLRFGR